MEVEDEAELMMMDSTAVSRLYPLSVCVCRVQPTTHHLVCEVPIEIIRLVQHYMYETLGDFFSSKDVTDAYDQNYFVDFYIHKSRRDGTAGRLVFRRAHQNS
jgi:hypothetical protein